MYKPRNQHPTSMLFYSFHVIRFVIFPLVLYLFTMIKREDYLIWVGLALGLLLIIAGGWGILSWARYTYQVVDGELRVNQGVIIRERRYIPQERIQAIDITENIFHRLLGVVQVNVETAGGSEPEVSLMAVKREEAERLRKQLMTRTKEEEPSQETPLLVHRLSFQELLLAGATSDQIGIALSFLGIFSSGLDRIFEWFNPFSAFDIPLDMIVDHSTAIWFAIFSVLFLLFLSWIIVIGGTVFSYAGFTIQRVNGELLIQRGLLERRRSTIPLQRIQAIRIVEGVLRQPFGLVSVYVESAGYGVDADAESTVLFPLLKRQEVKPFLQQFAPEFVGSIELKPLPQRARRRYIVRSCLPMLFPILFLSLFFFPFGLFSLLLLIPSYFWGRLKYRDAGWSEAEGRLLMRFRRLGRITVIIPRRRIQSGTVSATPFQRRANLVTLGVTVASSAIFRVANLEATTGESLLEWIRTGQRPLYWGKTKESEKSPHT